MNVSSLTETFGPTFGIVGFTDTGNVWKGNGYQFDESTGVLSVVPEPVAGTAIPLLGAVLTGRRRG